ncbi:hypothetical protein [Winogradskyella ludwigii]|uniref:hypothetical protein n=1 Tax=Winogradskyella ludwigii TaxID=2686076 RepID=UPI0015CA4ACE|nr:hypothetical protein [Winogradskyella ludwigii]
MKEEQANKIISLLEDIVSRLSFIESNTDKINDLTDEYHVLNKIKDSLENR